MSEFRKFFGQFSLGIQIGLWLGGVFFIACFVIAAILDRWWFNELLCIFGGVIGWFLGILGSPASTDQSEKFLEFRRAVSAFVSGFVLAKIEFFIDRLSIHNIDDPYLQLGRVLLFLITFCVALQFTFVTRLTGRPDGVTPG
jgi:hypothetical protein